MAEAIQSQFDLFATLPPIWQQSLLPLIQEKLSGADKVVVLDDDPTGTQTVYDVPVLTTWTVEALVRELAAPGPLFYILTNSRSLPLPAAQALNDEIGRALVEAGRQSGRAFTVVSRSDSTLRGHYPGEVDALAAALDRGDAAHLIIPFFREGGRYTIQDIHYVAEGDKLIPAAQTPFAQDAAFGYHASNLREWVAEKSEGRIQAEQVLSISLDDLRVGGPAAVQAKLATLGPGQVGVVNAADLRDLEVLVVALLDAEAMGQRFLYRTAASFVQVRAGLATRPLLTPAAMGLQGQAGGLFVVGSYVPKTTSQVQALLAQPGIVPVEVEVVKVLEPSTRQEAIDQAREAVARAVSAGQDTVLYTSRKLVSGNDAASSLAIGQQVSSALVAIVAHLPMTPRYLVAKGGITSSDIATQALRVRRAMVLGQIVPGVPVWHTGAESRLPGLAYVVFPGNVGDTDALVQVRAKLMQPH
ncbi:MAG: hypothetical protein IT328_17335 [Caldilineaceae bacterium]|nr:hypothetical protein [Caldilineaceae bacterium]